MASAAKSSASPTSILDAELLDLIERASRFFDLECGVDPGYFDPAFYPAWESLHVYAVGDIVIPTTANLHKYRVTTAGTSGASEPAWPTSSGGTVTNAGVVFTEHGADVIVTVRTFYGDGSNYLKLDPYVSGTLDEDIGMPDGYTAPDFIERDRYLVRTSSTGVMPVGSRPSYLYGWDQGVPITVTAKWGYESTPEDVKMAVIEMVINIWRETDPASVKLVGTEGQVKREAVPPRVKQVARHYRARQAVFV